METAERVKLYFGIVAAILAFIIIAGGFIIAFTRYRKRLATKQQELLKQDAEHKKALLVSNIESAEAERMRVAKDIHDEIGSIFSTLSLSVNRLQPGSMIDAGDLQVSNQLINTGIERVRRIAHSIIPFELELLGIDQALDHHFETFASLCHANVQYSNTAGLQELKPAAALAVYRIMQELCTNCVKYAQAKQVDVAITREDDVIHIRYHDDGVGTDLDSGEVPKGIGLRNIESRIVFLSGLVNFTSGSGNGFSCFITIPITINTQS